MHSQQKLASIYKKLMVNKTFHHFKGTNYKVTNIAVHSETGELRVIYSPNDNSELSWDRNLENFLSPVDKEKYYCAEQFMRFNPFDNEFAFNCTHTSFAIINNIIEYSPTGLSHKEWLIDYEGYTEEQYLNTIKGFVDIVNSGDIYFYQDNFDTNEIIEKYIKTFNNEVNGSLSYCEPLNGKTVLKCEPITKS